MILAVAWVALQAAGDPRLAGAFRKDQDGWVYVHLQGSPADIGYQYGTLLAPEIDDAHQAVSAILARTTGKAWGWYRDTAKRLFWPKLDAEYRQEMEGQAQGLDAKGLSYDVWDVLAFNAYIELSDYYLPTLGASSGGQVKSEAPLSCSAFVATGDETSDGRPVMGHNLWWDYTIGERFNAILDIKPQHGHEVMMDALCGLIDSASDFAINSDGIMLTETTISNFVGFDPNGIPEFERMRKAIQYSNDLDDVVRIFRDGNNGGYANTWLMADAKNGEIGRLQLGLKNVVFDRKNSGYYVGSNFPEDPKLMREECPGYDADPVQNGCERRRHRWNTLLSENKGKVDAALAEQFLGDTYDEVIGRHGAGSGTLCGRDDLDASAGFYPSGDVNAKVVTGALADKFAFWARMGFTDGSTLDAASYLGQHPAFSFLKPYLRSFTVHPWSLFPARR